MPTRARPRHGRLLCLRENKKRGFSAPLPERKKFKATERIHNHHAKAPPFPRSLCPRTKTTGSIECSFLSNQPKAPLGRGRSPITDDPTIARLRSLNHNHVLHKCTYMVVLENAPSGTFLQLWRRREPHHRRASCRSLASDDHGGVRVMV